MIVREVQHEAAAVEALRDMADDAELNAHKALADLLHRVADYIDVDGVDAARQRLDLPNDVIARARRDWMRE